MIINVFKCKILIEHYKMFAIIRNIPLKPQSIFFTAFFFLRLVQKCQNQPEQQQNFLNAHCEEFPDEPMCRMQTFTSAANQHTAPFCNYQDLWLIPGKADASCTRPTPRKLLELSAKQVKISPPIIKFPGCFTVEIHNVHVLPTEDDQSNLFAKTEFQWLNVRGSENSKCQNASIDGCGGFGNNCYYCDICESLKGIDERRDSNGIPAGIAEKLRGMNCPKEPGYYTFRKQFCFNDWRWLDADGDCRLDFLSDAEDQNGLRAALSALQQVGYGTVVAKIRIGFNATAEIARKKVLKEAQIQRMAERELDRKRDNWDPRKGSFAEFRQWYLAERHGKWHRNEYLPWLLYENEVACVRLTFDVCERQPQERSDGSGGFICI